MGFMWLALATDRDPWERQPGETHKMYGRFETYRDLPPSERSYKTVAKSYGTSLVTIQKQGSSHRWQERVAAWDNHDNAMRRAKLRERDTELCRAQMEIARAASAIAVKTIQSMAENGETLDATTLPRWVEMIERLRRIALDQPDQVVQLTGPDGGPVQLDARFENLSEEQRRERFREVAEGWLRVIEGGKA